MDEKKAAKASVEIVLTPAVWLVKALIWVLFFLRPVALFIALTVGWSFAKADRPEYNGFEPIVSMAFASIPLLSCYLALRAWLRQRISTGLTMIKLVAITPIIALIDLFDLTMGYRSGDPLALYIAIGGYALSFAISLAAAFFVLRHRERATYSGAQSLARFGLKTRPRNEAKVRAAQHTASGSGRLMTLRETIEAFGRSAAGAPFGSPLEYPLAIFRDGDYAKRVGEELAGWKDDPYQLLRFPIDQHVLVCGTSGSGKNVGLITPILADPRSNLDRNDPISVFVIDPKGENSILTASLRASWGRRVAILDPYQKLRTLYDGDGLGSPGVLKPGERAPVAGMMATFNPLANIIPRADLMQTQIDQLIAAMTPSAAASDGAGGHFKMGAEALLRGFIALELIRAWWSSVQRETGVVADLMPASFKSAVGPSYPEEASPSLENVFAWLTRFADDEIVAMGEAVGEMDPKRIPAVAELLEDEDSDDGLFETLIDIALTNTVNLRSRRMGDKELGSFISTLRNYANWALKPIDRVIRSGATWSRDAYSYGDPWELYELTVDDICAGETDLFIVMSQEDFQAKQQFVRILFQQISYAIMQRPLRDKRRLLMLLDEAPVALGKTDKIDELLAIGRSAGISVMYVCQSVNQITTLFKPDTARSMIENFNYKFFLRVNDAKVVEDLSKLMGDSTILVQEEKSVSTNQGKSDGGSSSGRSESMNTRTAQRRVITPDELSRMPSYVGLLFPPEGAPLAFRKIRYFLRPEYRDAVEGNPMNGQAVRFNSAPGNTARLRPRADIIHGAGEGARLRLAAADRRGN